MNITPETTRAELAAIVVQKLAEHGIKNVVLVGGSVVSLYTDNKYATRDLDFVSSADHKRLSKAMTELGFTIKGKDFVHTETEFTVEFPSGPLGIGDDVPISPEGVITINGIDVKTLSPTQSVMDRLINFFIYNDRQCLDQAIWIAQKHSIEVDQLKEWAKRERYEEKLDVFLNRVSGML